MIGIRGARSSGSEPLDLSFFDLTQNLLLIQLKLQILQLCLNTGKLGLANRKFSLGGFESSLKLFSTRIGFSHLSP